MADGDYERRQGREAEIKRLQRIIREQAEKRALPRASAERSLSES